MKYKLPIILSTIYILSTYLILFLPKSLITDLTKEDGLIENIGASYFFIASVTFFITYLLSKGQGIKFGRYRLERQPMFLLLGLLFFVAMGEEISWGQRIFGWNTPSAINEINSQGEINLHNISFVNGQNPDGTLKTGIASLLTSHRIFYALVVFWALLIPLGDRLFPKCQDFFKKLNFPIHPIYFGTLMLGILLIGKVIRLFILDTSTVWRSYISEISESNFAFITAIIAIYWLVQIQKKRTIEPKS